MTFALKKSYFEGPLDLLLTLIENKKLHISEIALSEVTEEYLHYLQQGTGHHSAGGTMHDQSQFIVIAATLILIKARSLLPTMELTPEETESIDDLTERLRLYDIIVRYGELLKKQWGNSPVFYRGTPPKEKKIPLFAPHESLNQQALITCLQELMQALPVVDKMPEQSVKKVLSLAEVMQKVEQAIHSGTFSMKNATDRYRTATDPVEKREAKVFVVLSFLALLEMVKKTQIIVEQENLFDDITTRSYQELS